MSKKPSEVGIFGVGSFIPKSEYYELSNGRSTLAGELIKQARLNSRLTQNELAQLSGETQSVLSSYERGLRQPSFKAVVRILAATGTHLLPRNSKVTKSKTKLRGERLEQVLELAAAFPSKAGSSELNMPRL